MAELQDIVPTTGIDMDYAAAFQIVNARGRKAVLVSDVVMDVRFNELGSDEAPILTGLGHSDEEESVQARRFGGGVKLNDYDAQFSMMNANQILNSIRIASVRLRAWVGYKEIATIGTYKQPLTEKYSLTGITDPEKIYKLQVLNAIFSLNEAYRVIINRAAQIKETPVDGQSSQKTAALPVNTDTRVLVYYNHAHEEFIRHIRSVSTRQTNLMGNGHATELFRSFIFMPPNLMPVSGAITNKKSVKRFERDRWGAFNDVKEYDSTGSIGVKMVIPGLRNIFPEFQSLTFGTDTKASHETRQIAAFERYNAAMDDRQHMHLQLRKGETK